MKTRLRHIFNSCALSFCIGVAVLALCVILENTADVPESWNAWLNWHWLRYGFFYLAAVLLAGIVVSFVVLVALVTFFPVAIPSHFRSKWAWIRTVCLTGGLVFFFFYHWHDCEFLSLLNRAQDALQNTLGRMMDDAESLPRVPFLSLLVFSESTILYVVACVFYIVGRRFVKAVQSLWKSLDERSAQAAAFVKHVFKQVIPSVKDERRGQITPALWACFVVNIGIVIFAIVDPDKPMSAAVVALAAEVLTVFGLSSLVKLRSDGAASGTGEKPTTEISGWHLVAPMVLTSLSVVYVISDAQIEPCVGRQALSVAGAHEPVVAIEFFKVVARDSALAILCVIGVSWYLARGWNNVIALESGNGAPSPGYSARIQKRLAMTAGIYLLSKLLVIALCLGGLCVSLDPGDPDDLDLSKQKPRLLGWTFAYMAWTGEILNAEDYLFATHEDYGRLEYLDDITASEEDYRTELVHFKSYHAPAYACLVVMQTVFGWNYGIHLLCYLLFSYALFVFQTPPVSPDQARRSVLAGGADERIRTSSEGITTLGFIGTLLGLSQAIFFLGKASPAQEFLEESGISSQLSASLGMAFFVTFIAMALRLTLTLRFAQLAGEKAGYRRLLERLHGFQRDDSTAG